MEIHTELEAQALLQKHYTLQYGPAGEKHDSPDRSRESLTKRIYVYLKNRPRVNILNIGSGPQSLEKQARCGSFEDCRFYTIDLAKILRRKKLLARRQGNVYHSQANGTALPFSDCSFDLVVSNHAIDFMPDSAFNEARRVLKDGGLAIFYFHDSGMIPKNFEDLNLHKNVEAIWRYLKDNNVLFSKEDEIREKMEKNGFKVHECVFNGDGKDNWWEVVLRKRG